MRYTSFIVLMLAAFNFPAEAETLKLDTISVELALPKDYCALSRSDPQDKQRYEQQERANGGRNVVLMIATPCDEVAASRAGENLRHWATWLQSGSLDRPLEVPGLARTEVFTEIAKNMPTTDIKKLVEEVDARTRKEGISV